LAEQIGRLSLGLLPGREGLLDQPFAFRRNFEGLRSTIVVRRDFQPAAVSRSIEPPLGAICLASRASTEASTEACAAHEPVLPYSLSGLCLE
jgi:hypothetical protein